MEYTQWYSTTHGQIQEQHVEGGQFLFVICLIVKASWGNFCLGFKDKSIEMVVKDSKSGSDQREF